MNLQGQADAAVLLTERLMTRSRFIISLIASLLIGAVLLFFAARELDFEQLESFLRGADWGRLALGLAGYCGLFGVVHAVRTWRWLYLVRPLGEVRAWTVIRAGLIGFAAIILLPFRLGELVRPYVLSRETSIPMSAALGTVVVERVIDGLFITLLLFLTLWTYDGGASTTFATSLGLVSLCVFTGALGVCVLALWKRSLATNLVARVVGWVSPSIAGKLVGMLGTFIDGIGAMRGARDLLPFLGLTLAYWTVNGLSIAFFGAWAFGLGLTPWAGMTLLAILVVGIMIPAGPGLAGNYEFFALQALALFEPAGTVAAVGGAFVAAMHIGQFVTQVAPGLVLVWWPRRDGSRLGLWALSRAARTAAEEQAEQRG